LERLKVRFFRVGDADVQAEAEGCGWLQTSLGPLRRIGSNYTCSYGREWVEHSSCSSLLDGNTGEVAGKTASYAACKMPLLRK